MAIGLIAWGRFFNAAGNKVTVPAPPTDPGKPWLWDFLRDVAPVLGASFDILQLPPWSLAQGGEAPGCDGYGVFQRRNLNGTRYGSLESLMSAVSALRAHGCVTYADLVLHQMSGENGGPGVFRYVGADGVTRNGRGQTTPGWFRGGPVPPFCREDDVPVPADDNPFGRELSYQNCHPADVTESDAVDYLRWSQARTGAVGFRFDDTKGTYAPAVRRIMDALPDAPFYSEFFDANPNTLNAWATSPPMSSRSAVVDFTLHFRIQAACNNFDATQLVAGAAGYWQLNPGLAVGFVDNPDTDTSPGEQVVSNKGLAYAYLLSLPMQLALVYGKDYFSDTVWPGAYGLKPLIDNLCWISRTFAFGNYDVRWIDRDVHVGSRDGNGGQVGQSGGLLTALNFNTLTPRRITCGAPFGPNRHLHDYAGHHEDIFTDGTGNATFTIPRMRSPGESFLCFAPAGVNQPVPSHRMSTTQTYFGAADLDVRPAMNTEQFLAQRLHCAMGSDVSLRLAANLPVGASLLATVRSAANGETLSSARIGSGVSNLVGRTKHAGWHTVSIEGFGWGTAGQNFELEATYMGVEG